mgnify:CR=1 FL=1
MKVNEFKLLMRFIGIALLLVICGTTSASIITIDYEFDTPVIVDEYYNSEILNPQLQTLGETITGSVTFDTEIYHWLYPSGNKWYTNFTSSGELDTLFGGSPHGLRTSPGDASIFQLFYWQNIKP